MAKPLLELKELRALEDKYNNILGTNALMERAGKSAADLVCELVTDAGDDLKNTTVTVLCGPGNNGGDGFVCARVLAERGLDVHVVQVAGKAPKAETPAYVARQKWEATGKPILDDPYTAPKSHVVIDAIFGIGLDKPMKDEFHDAVQWFNERQAIHISLDVPSGLNSQTGQWIHKTGGCVSNVTLTFLAGKPGLYTADGPDACGIVIIDDLDVSVPLSKFNIVEESDFRTVLAVRKRNSHKGTFGKVAVIGGAKGMVGAALIAAESALRMGAGSVYVELMDESAMSVNVDRPELMFRDKIDLSDMDAIVVGPGMGQSEKAAQRLLDALNTNVPVILDADALAYLTEEKEHFQAVVSRQSHTVLTPHPGEAARILKCKISEIQADRIFRAQELSVLTGAVTVLKGCGTVIAQRSGVAWICPTGTPALSTAGSGDALAGMMGAMFAQKFDFVSSVLSAVYLHGEAAGLYDFGIPAGDIAARAAENLNRRRQERKFKLSASLQHWHGRE